MGTAGRYDFYHFALTGGCTGSTSGSVKIFRWQVVWAYLKQSMIVATEPNRVVPIKIGNLTTSNSIISSVFVFISAFMATLVVLTVLVAWTGLDFSTAFSAVVACITNSGPGIGPVVGPAGTFAPLSDFAKYMLSLAMLLGRLEVLTVIVILRRVLAQLKDFLILIFIRRCFCRIVAYIVSKDIFEENGHG